MPSASCLGGALIAAALLVTSAPAQAAEGGGRPVPPANALEASKELYYEGRYQEAVFELEDLLAREELPTDIRIEALKYQAICLFLLQLNSDARDVWLTLLEVDPDHRLDPVEVSPEIVDFFNRITAAERAKREPKEEPPPEPPSEPKPKVEDERGCGIVLCLIPFGVGQFANDNILKGVIFAVLEAGFLAANIGIYWHRTSQFDAEGVPSNPDADERNLVMQNTSFGLFIGSLVIGIVDAFVFP